MKVSITVCLSVGTTGCPEAGGHLWAYLNWALGLRALAEEHCDARKVVGRMLERALA